jgi:hypothetical protein
MRVRRAPADSLREGRGGLSEAPFGARHEVEGIAPMHEEDSMLLIRDIMYCKPGKVRALVDKFVAMSKLSEKLGQPKMKIMTDVCSERYWTVVSEMEVASLKAFEEMFAGQGQNEQAMKEFESIMHGYHELVDHGRREIYKLEG